jgi:hypothetical protein
VIDIACFSKRVIDPCSNYTPSRHCDDEHCVLNRACRKARNEAKETKNGMISGQTANFAGTSVEKIPKENTHGEPNADLRSDEQPIGQILIAKKRRT